MRQVGVKRNPFEMGKERRNERLRIFESTWQVAEGFYFAICSGVLSPEGKDHVGGEREQLVCHQIVCQNSIISPNDIEHDDAEGWCKMATNYTKGRIAELIGDFD
ncbi:hypothetical protein H5410_003322 [Solanum commersonii]|uniref:Uncharacterized protein n=1 Tax=Solanum commersonii TaxID=4109 RepID=A0A9J6B4C7_SOLCO|nr:hypothetical protein H5410_003322 [Solanum commersonii]